MSVFLAFSGGYLIGSLPTANAIAGLFGIDLRAGGSGNPGTNNARRLGGYGLATSILLVEAAKGAGAVVTGGLVTGSVGMMAAGVGAVAGNVFNVWYRFRGGKGLGITLGVLLAAWPLGLVPIVVVIAALALITRSTGWASLGALVLLVTLGILWFPMGWPTGWGVSRTSLLPWLALGLAVVLAPKHLNDLLATRPQIRE
ncbi:MAG: glycerol-3-phosphate acyltransferase [Acidimicrobiia bacterium]